MLLVRHDSFKVSLDRCHPHVMKAVLKQKLLALSIDSSHYLKHVLQPPTARNSIVAGKAKQHIMLTDNSPFAHVYDCVSRPPLDDVASIRSRLRQYQTQTAACHGWGCNAMDWIAGMLRIMGISDGGFNVTSKLVILPRHGSPNIIVVSSCKDTLTCAISPSSVV